MTGLTGGVDYYWRVSAKNVLGSSTFSEIYTFRTLLALPGKPQLASPSSFESNVNRSTSLTWNAVSGATTYKVQLSLTPDFSSIVAQDSTITGLTYKPSFTLTASTNYYWRVSAKNAAGTGEWSNPYMFTTGTQSPILPGIALARFTRVAGAEYLRFALGREGRVQVRLYEAHGRLEALLLDETRARGEHSLRLPSDLGTGLHFLEFRSPEGRDWLKIHP